MYLDGRFQGQPFMTRLSKGVSAQAAGTPTEINFDAAQAELKGYEAVVESILLQLPIPTLTVIPGETLMGSSLLQLLKDSISLNFATEAPPKDSGMKEANSPINGIDAFRLATMQEFLTGVPLIRASGGLIKANSSAVAGSGSAIHFLQASASDVCYGAGGHVRGTFPNRRGPYGWNGSGAAGNASWTDGIEVEFSFLPLGADPLTVCPPLSYFTGASAKGDTECGNLRFTLQDGAIDAAGVSAVAWGAQLVNVWARCYLRPADRRAVPRIPVYRAYSSPSSDFRAVKMPTVLLALMKELAANGDMQDLDYTQVQVLARGREMVYQQVVNQTQHVNDVLRAAGREGFMIPTNFAQNGAAVTSSKDFNATISTAKAKNMALPWVPLIAEPGVRPEYAAGSADEPMAISIPSGGSGEATHYVVQAGYVPANDAFDKSNQEWSGYAGQVTASAVKSHTGQTLSPAVQALHGKVQIIRPMPTKAGK